MTSAEPQPLPASTRDASRRRLDMLRDAVASHPADGVLVTNDVDIRYLTGFIGHDSLLLVLPDSATIVSDPRYDEHLDPWRQAEHLDVVIGVRHRLEPSILDLARSAGAASLAVQADFITVADLDALRSNLPGIDFVTSTGLVGRLRMIKDELEITHIEQAITVQEDALQAALGSLELDVTETAFAARLEYEMRCRGAAGPAFPPIVGAGSNSSIPHHETGRRRIERGTLLIDWGAAMPDGYNGDLTRTFGVGELPPAIREIYPIVLEAQLAAIEASRPGRRCADVDAVARRIISDAGYGERFGHGLGHGLGLDVHEAPYFSPTLGDVELQPGMVMTVEPGIYLPGVGGVRIEDDVLITDDGPRVLSSWPKGLDAAIIEPASFTTAIG